MIAGLLSANGVSQATTPAHVVASTGPSSSSKGSRLDQTVSSTVGTGIVLGTPTNLGGTGASTLTSGLAVSGQGGGIVGLQALSSQVSSVQAQPAIEHDVASTLVNQSPAPTSNALPGQSLLGDSEPLSPRTIIDDSAEPVSLIDDTALVQSKTPIQEEAPTPLQEEAPTPLQEETPTPLQEETPTSRPARATRVPSDPAPVLPEEPKNDSATDHFDLALAQISESQTVPGLEPVSPSSGHEKAPADRPASSMASLAGTAVVVAGGYRLVLGRSDRIRRRWSTVRFR